MANSNPILPPLSVCSILKDEEIYNSIEPENENDNEADNDAENIPENDPEPENDDLPIKKVDANPKSAEDNDATALANESEQLDDLLKTNEIELSMYQDGKSLCVVLQNVHEKWLLKKKDILLRQKRESESLQAIQKLNWQWRDKELNFTDTKSAGKLTVEDRFVPIVSVLDFELLPNL